MLRSSVRVMTAPASPPSRPAGRTPSPSAPVPASGWETTEVNTVLQHGSNISIRASSVCVGVYNPAPLNWGRTCYFKEYVIVSQREAGHLSRCYWSNKCDRRILAHVCTSLRHLLCKHAYPLLSKANTVRPASMHTSVSRALSLSH